MAVIGVIAFQGDFSRHIDCVGRIGHSAVTVRRPEELSGIDGLIIPGGESTTIGMLMDRFGLLDAVRLRVSCGMGLFGTCAGAILMASAIDKSDQPRLALLDMDVKRNAYGRQIESFEAEVDLSPLSGGNSSAQCRAERAESALTAVFIRAPMITRTGPGVDVLSRFESNPVLVRKDRLLAATFHPELTADLRIHRYFAGLLDG